MKKRGKNITYAVIRDFLLKKGRIRISYIMFGIPFSAVKAF